MDHLPKAIIVFSTIIVAGLFAITYVNTHIQVNSAKKYQSSMAEKLQASNFSEYVIEKCQEETKDAGYETLEVNKKEEKQYEIILKYKIKHTLFQSDRVYERRTYAREVHDE